jgi:hypothetical protein
VRIVALVLALALPPAPGNAGAAGHWGSATVSISVSSRQQAASAPGDGRIVDQDVCPQVVGYVCGPAEIWADKTVYGIGEVIRICYRYTLIEASSRAVVTWTLPSGSSVVVHSAEHGPGAPDSGGVCFSGVIGGSARTGSRQVRLEVYLDDRVVTSAETSFEVARASSESRDAGV